MTAKDERPPRVQKIAYIDDSAHGSPSRDLEACSIMEERPAFLQELPGVTIFEGDVLKIEHDWGVDYDVQNGGWSSDGPNSPDTWLSEHVLARFNGKRVRVTIEELGESTRYRGHPQP